MWQSGSSARGLGLAVFAVAALGCAGKQDGAGPGADCYRDEDCQVGLVCVPKTPDSRACSKDVTGLASTVPGPPPAEDAGTPTDDAAAPEPDAG